MLLDTQHDLFPWGTLQSAWRLLDRTVEVEKMQGLCRLGVRQFVVLGEMWYAVSLMLCWNSAVECDQHPEQYIYDTS